MTNLSSSRNLHPDGGARFVFERDGEQLRYRVDIYLPGERSWSGELTWVDDHAHVRGPESAGDEQLSESTLRVEEMQWAQAELIKLARVLHRDPKPRLVRWRG